jgi:ribosomal-protein-alanine N-acetyltransferase
MIVEGRAFAVLLARLHAASFAPAERWDAAAMAALLDMPGCFACLHEGDDGAPCGMALLRVVADEAELLTIAVLPAARGRRAGTDLVEQALREAGRRGACRMFLEVACGNETARALYLGQGFSPIGRRQSYYADGSDALVLARALHRDRPDHVPSS